MVARASAIALLLQGTAGLQVGGPARTSVAPIVARSSAPMMEMSKLEPTLPGTLDKRAERRRIMSEDKYKRGNAPFDKTIHADVSSKMSEQFASTLVKEMREASLREVTRGEGDRSIVFRLAKDYGFCWGVERSIELAWAARDAYPDKPMHITNELIHNPGVNDLLRDMNINFIEKTEEGKRFSDIADGDVVILPAFGASLEEMQMLDARGVTVVDTTCPWVSKVWTTVDKHAQKDMTSVIHGKWAHEESVATASMAQHYIIIKDMAEAQEIASYIMGEEGALTDEELLAKYSKAISKGFDPKKHLKKIGETKHQGGEGDGGGARRACTRLSPEGVQMRHVSLGGGGGGGRCETLGHRRCSPLCPSQRGLGGEGLDQFERQLATPLAPRTLRRHRA